jgi:exosortase/archaeosortase family protein
MIRQNHSSPSKAVLVGAAAVFLGLLALRLFPALQMELFARGAAQLIGFFTGAPVSRDATGWMIPLPGAPIVVTTACSAVDYFLIVACLIAFQVTRLRVNAVVAVGLGIGAALPVAIFVNAVRIITVAYAHPWLISRLPPTYESFLHLVAGAAVFLPSLILLNLLLETYGRHRCPSARV